MPNKKKLGELLIESGAASEHDVRQALGQQRAFGNGMRLGEVMVSMNLITPTALARALALQHDLPFIQLPDIPAHVSALLPLDYQSEHGFVPFKLDADGKRELLHLAVQDPSRLEEVDDLRFQLRKQLKLYVAASDDIENALAFLRDGGDGEVLEALPLDDAEEMEVERGGSAMHPSGWHGGASADAAQLEAVDRAASADWEALSALASPLPGPAAAKPATNAAQPQADGPSAAMRSAQADLDALFGAGEPPPVAEPPRAPAPKGPAQPAQVMKFAPKTPPPAPAEAKATPPPPPPEEDWVVPPPAAAPTAAAKPAPPPTAAAQAPAAPTASPAAPTASTAAPTASTAELRRPNLEISEQDLRILDDLEQMAQGSEPSLDTEKVRPARMVASLIRLLIRKGVIHELEFLEELARK